jgi:TfoX/Sxy family transcriptional regulator of competence genes
MQIPRPTDADRQRFKSLVPDDARVEVKPMFGNLGAFVNGNMFMGLFGTEVGVKLDDADHCRRHAQRLTAWQAPRRLGRNTRALTTFEEAFQGIGRYGSGVHNVADLTNVACPSRKIPI